jgi:uncharacterized protein
MLVNIEEIKESGLRRSWEVPREAVDEIVAGDRAGYRAGGPAHVEAHLDKVGRRVRVEGHARLKVEVACGRCLSPVELDLPVDFEVALVPADQYREESGPEGDSGPVAGSFDPRAVDEDTYAGKVIDLSPIVREQIQLALPGYPVCREGCNGLCTVCGTNLNEKECGCDRHVPDPRWAGLRHVKLQ